MNNYEELLKPQRIRTSSRGSVSLLQETESDRARVIYSAAFRRLQRKTQVFPLEENAAVRSRLTHSLEVAHVGRYLVTSVLEKMGTDRDKFGIDANCALAMVNTVETACLLHDIGNPPFGHFGEAAISNWFKDYLARSRYSKNDGVSALNEDMRNFDGNPQGFRSITKLAGADGKTGMNLTFAQIASTVKYPISAESIDLDNPLYKKAGVYSTEKEVWTRIKDGLNLGDRQRFPLAYLMEAADDISYCLSDIEDGIEKGILKYKEFVDFLSTKSGELGGAAKEVNNAISTAEKNENVVDRAVSFRSKLITYLVKNAAGVYVDEHDAIWSGAQKGLVETDSESGRILKAIKETVRTLLYGKRSSHERELAGHAAIRGVLKSYECLLEISRDDFDCILLGRAAKVHHLQEELRLFSLMANKHIVCYKNSVTSDSSQEDEWMMRVRLVVDYVAGMTDVFTLRTYQNLSGISL